MKHYITLIPLLLVLLTLTTIPIVTGQIDRHTLGFPDKAQLPEDVNTIMRIIINNTSSGENRSLIIYSPSLEETPETLKDIEKLINSGKIPISTRDLNRLRDISDLGFIDAISRIENEDLKKLLQNLYTTNSTLTHNELEQLLSYLKTLKAQGKITHVDEILALRALIELFNNNETYSRELLNNIILALRELESGKFANNLIQSIPTPQLEQSITDINEQPLLPRLSIPQLNLLPTLPQLKHPILATMPQQLIFILISSILVVIITMLLHHKTRIEISTILTNILHRAKILHYKRALLSTPSSISDVYLDMYWKSVNIIEALTGIKREISTTHREYLEQVRGKLRKDLLHIFANITKAYETYKYACSKNSAIQIAENYKRLVSGINVKTNNTSS